METAKKYIPQIAAKLINEGVDIFNYDFDRAAKVLRQTVAPKFCVAVLMLHEISVLGYLCTMKETY